jgi:hypothetical protein
MEIITKWCISRTENYYEPINKWFNKNTKLFFLAKTDFHPKFNNIPAYRNYLHYPQIGNASLFSTIKMGYTVITHEEFEKFILNKNEGAKLLKTYRNSNEKKHLQIIRK